MSLISYAQNFEDVMLWRALKHIECGFYIDIGAWSPDLDSVTKAFYERGWHGINVEPNPQFHRQLEERRPRDTNLCLAVGDHEDVLVINFLSNSGLSTIDDTIANRHQQAGWEVNRQPVQVTTLAALWKTHIHQEQEVHFLKVDVEGLEAAVLGGNNWSKNRPWVVVVEATLPMSQEESHQIWEHILLNANYEFAYADGLNRFYVANEHADLLPAFKYPPNVFDDFLLSHQQEAEAKAQEAETRAAEQEQRAITAENRAAEQEQRAITAENRAAEQEQRAITAETKVQQAETQMIQVQQENQNLHRALAEVHSSLSIRITAPLRWAGTQARRLKAEGPKARSTAFIKKLLRKATGFVTARPRLKRLVISVAERLGLAPRLRRMYWGATLNHLPANAVSSDQKLPTELSALTPRARQIYADLKAAIERHQARLS